MKLYIFRIFLLLAITNSSMVFATHPADPTTKPVGEQILQLGQLIVSTKEGKIIAGLLGGLGVSSVLAIIFLALKVRSKNGEIEGEKQKNRDLNHQKNNAFEDGKKNATESLTQEIYKKIKSDVSDEEAKNPINLKGTLDTLMLSMGNSKTQYDELKTKFDTLTNDHNDILTQISRNNTKSDDHSLLKKEILNLKTQLQIREELDKKMLEGQRNEEYENAKNDQSKKENQNLIKSTMPGQKANMNHPYFEKVNDMEDEIEATGPNENLNVLYKYKITKTQNINDIFIVTMQSSQGQPVKNEIHLEIVDNNALTKLKNGNSFDDVCLERAQSSMYKMNQQNKSCTFIFMTSENFSNNFTNIINSIPNTNQEIEVCAVFCEKIVENVLQYCETNNYKINTLAVAGLGKDDRKFMQNSENSELLKKIGVILNLYTDKSRGGFTNRYLINNELENPIVNFVIDEINEINDDENGRKMVKLDEPFKRIERNDLSSIAFYAFSGLFYGLINQYSTKDVSGYSNYRYTYQSGRGFIQPNVGFDGREKNDRGYFVVNKEKLAETIRKNAKRPYEFIQTSFFNKNILDLEELEQRVGIGKFNLPQDQEFKKGATKIANNIKDNAFDGLFKGAKIAKKGFNLLINVEYGSYLTGFVSKVQDLVTGETVNDDIEIIKLEDSTNNSTPFATKKETINSITN